MPAAPAPLTTILIWSMRLPVSSTAFTSAALVIVEDRDLHRLFKRLLDIKALWRFDVFEVDAAEGGLQQLAGLDDLVGIMCIQFDVEHVDVSEPLEQDTFAFHDRLAGQGADVAQSQHGGAVGYHRHQIAFGGVLECILRVLLDLQAGIGDSRCVGETKIALRKTRLGGSDFYFSRP